VVFGIYLQVQDFIKKNNLLQLFKTTLKRKTVKITKPVIKIELKPAGTILFIHIYSLDFELVQYFKSSFP